MRPATLQALNVISLHVSVPVLSEKTCVTRPRVSRTEEECTSVGLVLFTSLIRSSHAMKTPCKYLTVVIVTIREMGTKLLSCKSHVPPTLSRTPRLLGLVMIYQDPSPLLHSHRAYIKPPPQQSTSSKMKITIMSLFICTSKRLCLNAPFFEFIITRVSWPP